MRTAFGIAGLCLLLLLSGAAPEPGFADTLQPQATGLSPGVPIRLARTRWIGDGSAAPKRVVYVFTDPECPYCHKLWEALRLRNARDVQVRYVLVGVIKPSSAGKAAAILQAPDPAAKLIEHEQRYAQGGVVAEQTITPETMEELAVNESLMNALRIFATPALIYTNERGQVLLFAGLPSGAELQAILDGAPVNSSSPSPAP